MLNITSSKLSDIFWSLQNYRTRKRLVWIDKQNKHTRTLYIPNKSSNEGIDLRMTS